MRRGLLTGVRFLEIDDRCLLPYSKSKMIIKIQTSQVLVLVFSLSSIGATFVNKYVLSVLKFTYPTVYQSWQMGFVLLMLMTISSFGMIQFSSLDKSLFSKWLPAVIAFTIGIYSGSKALSLLPVPIFCVMYNLVYVFITVVEEVIFKQTYSSICLLGLVASTFGMIFTIHNDSEIDYKSYKWMLIHTICVAFYSLYAKRANKLPLKELDKILFNSSFSVISLILIGSLSGEVGESIDFPFLHYNRFHIGCVLSGLTGSLVLVSYSKLTDLMLVSKVRWINSLSMALMSILSIFIFDFTLSSSLALSVAVGLAGSVLYTYAVYQSEYPKDGNKDEKKIPI